MVINIVEFEQKNITIKILKKVIVEVFFFQLQKCFQVHSKIEMNQTIFLFCQRPSLIIIQTFIDVKHKNRLCRASLEQKKRFTFYNKQKIYLCEKLENVLC